ncbi:MAG: HAMP domain-containing sensor histidine kinase [Chamaesiphon sp.]
MLFATGVYVYVRSTLIERVDDTLNHVVEVVLRSLVIAPTDSSAPGSEFRVNIDASFRDNADTVDDDHIDLEWFSPTGQLLWSTLSEPQNIPLYPNRTGETVRAVRGEGLKNSHDSPLFLRQVTERVQRGRQVLGYLRVSHPWFEVTKPIHQLLVDLSLGTIGMVISVAAIGWLLSGIAIKPVRESYQRLKQFTADASHELRSPIATIQTNVQVALADPDPLPQVHRQQLQVVERLTRRLGRLVDDLLFLARQDSGMVQLRLVLVPLDALLVEVIEEQHLFAVSKGISLSLDIVAPDTKEDDFTILGDWEQLARLFTNIFSNAVQYTPTSDQVHPSMSVHVELQRIRRSSHYYLQVKVKDTGIGIPVDALSQLFDRFYRVDLARTKGTTSGSGLGLAIAAAIAENHQGHIQVESTLNQGTTVTVTLPSYDEKGRRQEEFGEAHSIRS